MTTETAPVEPAIGDSVIGTPETPKESVSYETYRRTVSEAKTEREQRRKLEAELTEFRKKEQEAKEADLARRGEFDQVLKLREEENQKLRESLNVYNERMQKASKLNAFIKAAGADLDDKWLGLVDVDSIVVLPDDEIDQLSVKKTVETFRKTWPEAFKQKSIIPNDMPNGTGFITESEWKKIPSAAERKKYKQNQIQWGK
jgi:hypothetical protein